jgi:hypothetical protein
VTGRRLACHRRGPAGRRDERGAQTASRTKPPGPPTLEAGELRLDRHARRSGGVDQRAAVGEHRRGARGSRRARRCRARGRSGACSACAGPASARARPWARGPRVRVEAEDDLRFAAVTAARAVRESLPRDGGRNGVGPRRGLAGAPTPLLVQELLDRLLEAGSRREARNLARRRSACSRPCAGLRPSRAAALGDVELAEAVKLTSSPGLQGALDGGQDRIHCRAGVLPVEVRSPPRPSRRTPRPLSWAPHGR